MIKGCEGTLYIGGVKVGAVTLTSFDWSELEPEESPPWPGLQGLSATPSPEYNGTKGQKANGTKGKKLNRPLQK